MRPTSSSNNNDNTGYGAHQRPDPVAVRRNRAANIYADNMRPEEVANAPNERLREISHARRVLADAGPTLSTVGKRTRADVRASQKIPGPRGFDGREKRLVLERCKRKRQDESGTGNGSAAKPRVRFDVPEGAGNEKDEDDDDDGAGGGGSGDDDETDEQLAQRMGDMTTDQDMTDLTSHFAAMKGIVEEQDGTDATGVNYEEVLMSKDGLDEFEEGHGGQFDPKAGLTALRNCPLWQTVRCNLQLLVAAIEADLGVALFGCRSEWAFPRRLVNTVAGSAVAKALQVPPVRPICPFRPEDMPDKDGFPRLKAKDLQVVRLDASNPEKKGSLGGYAHTRGLPIVVHRPSRMAYVVDTHIAAYFGISWPFVWRLISWGLRSHQIKYCPWAMEATHESAQEILSVLRADWGARPREYRAACEPWIHDVSGGLRVYGYDAHPGTESPALPSLCQIITGLDAIKSIARTITEKMCGNSDQTNATAAAAATTAAAQQTATGAKKAAANVGRGGRVVGSKGKQSG